MSDKISLDVKYAQQLIDYWTTRYEAAQAELEKAESSVKEAEEAKAKIAELEAELQAEKDKCLAAQGELEAIQNASTVDKDLLRDKVTAQDQEIKDLLTRLNKAETERAGLTHQVSQLYSQASVLAAEADKSRKAHIAELWPHITYVDKLFEPQVLLISDSNKFLSALSERIATPHRLYFLPRPPACMPLRVPACAHGGYWFYPLWIPGPEDAEFELVVEGQPNLWTYLGRYTTSLLSGQEMRLCEWMVLDEQTKSVHAARVAAQSLGPGQKASYASEIAVKRRYELGEWSVPCYGLRCVGFDMALYDAMRTTVLGGSRIMSPAASVSSVPVSLKADSVA